MGLPRHGRCYAPAPRGEFAFGGISELWFDSPEAFRAAMASSEWQATVEDPPNFVVAEKTWLALVDEGSIV